MTFEEWWATVKDTHKGIDKDGWYVLLKDDQIYKDVARLAWFECLKNMKTALDKMR